MRKKALLPIGLVFVLLTQALLVVGASAQTAEWTFMIYVCADNDLESSWAPDLEELESVGSTAAVNFVALVDLASEDGSELIYIEQGTHTVVETYSEQNLGDPQVAINFITTVQSYWPANRYVLDFWDHGNGFESVCWDQGDEDWLDCPKLGQIMDAVGFIDIIVFDACTMAHAETYYEFISHADYVVGSEESVPLDGYPNDANALDLVNNPTQDTQTYAIELVTNYGDYYWKKKGYGYETLSAVDVSQLPALTTAFTDWTTEMSANLGQYKRQYTAALRGAKKMATADPKWFVDMYNYMLELQDENVPASLKTAAENAKTAVDNAVVINWMNNKQKDCYGLHFFWSKAIYWTGSWTSLGRDIYLSVAWGQTTGWTNFLDAYFGM
jgi:hypothetical protein